MALISTGSKVLYGFQNTVTVGVTPSSSFAFANSAVATSSNLPSNETSPSFVSLVQIKIGKCPCLCQKQLPKYMPKRFSKKENNSAPLDIFTETYHSFRIVKEPGSDEKICTKNAK